MWCYWTTSGTQTTIVSFNNGSNSGINLWKNTSNQLVADDGINGQTAFSTVTPTINAWNHIAFVRNGTTTSAYVNGVLAGSNSFTPLTTSAISIGRYNASAFYYFPGYISNLRVVNGTAVYTGAFTPPYLPLTTGGVTSSASYTSTTNVNTVFGANQTSLLTNFTNAGIYDAAWQNNPTTVGDAQVSTTQAQWPTTSMKFDGTGDYLTFPSNPKYAFGTGDFTIEAWVYSNDVSGATQRGWIQTSDTAGGLKTSYTTGVAIFFGAGAGGVAFTGGINANVAGTIIGISSAVVTTGAWYQIAVTRASGTVSIFVNGTLITSGSAAGSCTGTYLAVGGYYNTSYLLNGYVQDLRITNYARYTSNFSVPTSPFPTR
jgi:hypothetical protein